MRRLRNILLTATALMPIAPAFAGPQGGVVVNGSAQINNPGTANVTRSDVPRGWAGARHDGADGQHRRNGTSITRAGRPRRSPPSWFHAPGVRASIDEGERERRHDVQARKRERIGGRPSSDARDIAEGHPITTLPRDAYDAVVEGRRPPDRVGEEVYRRPEA